MKNWKIPVVFLLLVIMLVGCSNDKGSQENGQSELEKISIMLDWYPNAVHSALYVAKEKGYFEEQGLDVEIQMPADTNDPLKLAATGKVDLAISYQSQVVQSRAEGIPVVSVAAYVRHSLDSIMMKKETGINSPKDLEGKSVGYPSTVITEAVIKTMVEHDGGDFSKVKMTDVGWDLIPAVATDKVDAIGGGYINHELVLLNKEGYEMEALRLDDYGVPDNYELVIVAGEKTFNKKKASIEKFWQAVTKGQQFVKEDPEAGLQILLANENADSTLDAEVEKESLKILLPLMEDEGVPFGYQEEESWQNVANWLYEAGVIDTKVEPQQFVQNIVSK
ncbi:ABC transporter substrate-binding protein [Solibacillus sp. MA9]|uniref:ABC transporter substrate-binding protein n=1 Tax=Solibacillus palustris TaxID=2908203 RepID=A0ABS9UIY4_9BACL|nr:ABC transporter substrate-binding protein [Solibacillus sp. MA9]MCH7323890.1 ABC transporter substrate-binding protein [Solibacillus sp. MA9]